MLPRQPDEWRGLWLAAFLAGLAGCAVAAESVTTPTPAPPATNSATSGPPSERDAAAGQFLTRCAGCHSLEGRKLTGPELSHVGAWMDDQLKTTIKRMEKNVGPLKDDDINQLAELLHSAKVRERLKAEEARIVAMFAAKMEPPSAAAGRALFTGEAPLKNGGLACAACHQAGRQGGSLGPNLNGALAKLGETPLISAIEKSSFKIMEPHFRRHPVTRQEAMHLVKYLATLDPNQVAGPRGTIGTLGSGCGLAALMGLVYYQRNQRQERRRDVRLQRRRK